MDNFTAGICRSVLLPIKRLKSVAALSGLRAALLYARQPTYLLPRLSTLFSE